MDIPVERILIVENDPTIAEAIARQALLPLGYAVRVVKTAAAAFQEVAHIPPDLLIVDLQLPDLSGKDFLVALPAQGVKAPVIVLSQKEADQDIVQAFRLGAADYLCWPARETEVVSVVERVLGQMRSRREKEQLALQLKRTNQELQRRVRELTTLFAIVKAVTSIKEQQVLYDKIVEGAVFVSEADLGWLLLRQAGSRAFLLTAQRNLPQPLAGQIGRPWDDGISSLVGISGEPLAIHGEPLQRFKISRLGQSALIVPLKAQGEIIGLLVVFRKAPRPFCSSTQALIEAIADYASISLVRARP